MEEKEEDGRQDKTLLNPIVIQTHTRRHTHMKKFRVSNVHQTMHQIKKIISR